MNDKRVNAGAGGIGIPAVVQIVFIILKLTGNINWSWIWVLSPMWICMGLFMLIMLGFDISNCHITTS